MNLKNRTVTRIIYTAMLLLTAAFTALRSYMVLQELETGNTYYTSDLLHNILRIGLMLCAAVIFAIAHIYIKEEKNEFYLPKNSFYTASSYLTGLSLCGLLLYTLAKFVILQSGNLFDLFLFILAIPALLYHFTNKKNREKRDYFSILNICTALVCLVLVFRLYFNSELSYNNPTLVLAFSAFVFIMLATAAESNFELNRPALRRYISYAPMAVILSFSLSVPNLIFLVLRGAPLLSDFYYDILVLVLGIYHLARITALSCAKAEE